MTDDEILPAGRVVRVEMEVVLPVAASRREVDDWISFEVGAVCTMAESPLSSRDLVVPERPMLTDTGLRLREERSPGGKPGTFVVRRWREA